MPKAGEDALEVAAPADRDRHRADGVLENQVPADHPREDLAERGVGVGVGAAGDRNHRRELGVAQRGEGADEAGHHVRQHDARARLVCCRRAREDEDAGPDDRADPEQGQVHRRERAFERLGTAFGVSDQLLDRLGLQEIRIHSPSRKGIQARVRLRGPSSAPGIGVKTASVYLERVWPAGRRGMPGRALLRRRLRECRMITATADAPAATTDAARSRVMPPMATTGLPRPAA